MGRARMQFQTNNQCTGIDLKRKQGRYIMPNNLKECLLFSSLLQWLIQVAKQTKQELQYNFNS